MLIIAHYLKQVRESALQTSVGFVGMSARDSYQYTTDKPLNSKHRHCADGSVMYSTKSPDTDLSAKVLWDITPELEVW